MVIFSLITLLNGLFFSHHENLARSTEGNKRYFLHCLFWEKLEKEKIERR